jgi:hypothetical protein
MLSLALWLKKNKFKPDQVQTFYPSPMALATAMYHSGRNPLKKLHYKSEKLLIPKKLEQRRLQKAFLRYHDPANFDMLREALVQMGRGDLIGTGDKHLVPPARPGWQQRAAGLRQQQLKSRQGGGKGRAVSKSASKSAPKKDSRQ